MVSQISEHSACQTCQYLDNQSYDKIAPETECKEILHFCKVASFGRIFVNARLGKTDFYGRSDFNQTSRRQ